MLLRCVLGFFKFSCHQAPNGPMIRFQTRCARGFMRQDWFHGSASLPGCCLQVPLEKKSSNREPKEKVEVCRSASLVRRCSSEVAPFVAVASAEFT